MRSVNKIFITTILLFAFLSAYGQHYRYLVSVLSKEKIPDGLAIIYGNFIQRLGFSSGGFTQDIRIYHVEAKEILTFEVKPIFKMAKKNAFCYKIKPGTYIILNYHWVQGKWYGAKFFVEPIYKGLDNSFEMTGNGKQQEILHNDLSQFAFTVTANTLNYLGTWHFETGLVSFTDDKDEMDIMMNEKYQNLDFSKALTVLPN